MICSFAGRMWLAGRSLETPGLESGVSRHEPLRNLKLHKGQGKRESRLTLVMLHILVKGMA
jgi:hypothetical protein